ncbi:MAG: RdgB/HAM1 family non-canonical purine NTP pyrophosphatase [Candidatus Cloacimonetes bacterium]|nr:RdgB/HAM1 family non-canonical purine NTP pyrophosphatase [Candidatus Cloacimonadota bacterium]
MKILLGTHNPDKIREIRDILADVEGLKLLSDLPGMPEVVEDGDTIEANAVKKAVETARATGMPTLSDDTGFFVDALNDAPGVYAARFAGENCTYRDNRLKMLRHMKGEFERTAHFRTVVALADKDGLVGVSRGSVCGRVTHEERGEGGFGYDAIFLADETGLTFGEMSDENKNAISHRGRAFRAAIPMIVNYINKHTQEGA